MTIQSLLPNTLSINIGSKFNSLNQSLLCIIFGGCSTLMIAPSATPQSTAQINTNLPPPPPLSPRSRIIRGNRITKGSNYDILPIANVEPPTSNYVGREYTFSAPNKPQQPSVVGAYRVEVLGNSDRLLEQVRSIEPKAFLKGDIIQVGIFSEQENAANLVRQLALQGFWARIVSK